MYLLNRKTVPLNNQEVYKAIVCENMSVAKDKYILEFTAYK